MNGNIGKSRHPLLPQSMPFEALQEWLPSNAMQTLEKTVETPLTEQEKTDLAFESQKKGIEINTLNEILADVAERIKKGNEKAIKITIPQTKGTKVLDKHRYENDELAKTGFHRDTKTLYGIPCEETERMEFFDIDGTHYEHEGRSLSAREKYEFKGMFQNGQNSGSKMYVPGGFDGIGKTGTEGE